MLTTHYDPRGVAKGVVEVFRNVLERSARRSEATSSSSPISTTQATNALLEGDVARVGVIGMASRWNRCSPRARAAIEADRAGARPLT